MSICENACYLWSVKHFLLIDFHAKEMMAY